MTDHVAALAEYFFEGVDVEVVVMSVGDQRISTAGICSDRHQAFRCFAVPQVGPDCVDKYGGVIGYQFYAGPGQAFDAEALGRDMRGDKQQKGGGQSGHNNQTSISFAGHQALQ